MNKAGIEVTSAVVVEVFNVVKDVRLSLPKLGPEDIGRIWDGIKNGAALAKTDWKVLVAEAKDYSDEERKELAGLVEFKLQEQGIESPNGAAITQHSLELLSVGIALAGDFTPKV